jgi:hypothetical protein
MSSIRPRTVAELSVHRRDFVVEPLFIGLVPFGSSSLSP